MIPRTIRVSSRALGIKVHVTAYVYDSLDDLRRAAETYNGNDCSDVLAVCQARVDDDGRADTVLIRLARGHLGTRIVSHEMHHAATALYGSAVADRPSRRVHLTHHNEPFAHLYSDLLGGLVDRLYALGYYEDGGTLIPQPPDPPCHETDCPHPCHCARCGGVHHAVPSMARHCESD